MADPMQAAAEAAYEAHVGGQVASSWENLTDGDRARWLRIVQVAIRTHGKASRQAAKDKPPPVPAIPEDALEQLAKVYDQDGRATWTAAWRARTTTTGVRTEMLQRLARAGR